MLRKAILLATVATLMGGAAFAQSNELVNGDFESNPPPKWGNNVGYPIAPWVVASGSSPNVVKVDGPGGVYDYMNNGPESDASAPGAGIPQHYLDIDGSSATFYQSFTARCSGDVELGGAFSTRVDSPATASMAFRPGVGVGTGSANSINLPGGTSKTDPWTLVSFAATVTANLPYSLVVTMDNKRRRAR